MKKHIPNIITCCNLICGCVAVWLGFGGNFGGAFAFIMFGAVFDFFDGMAARKLGVSGPMGVELDSLADIVTFGMAPGAMLFTLMCKVCYPMFMYSTFWFKVMPFTAFLVPAFSALRLAKFNIDERQHTTFIGMPTPANALFWSSLLFSCPDYLMSPMFNAMWLFLFIVMFCWLLVSEVPMFSLKMKSMKWTENKVRFLFLGLCAVVFSVCLVIGIGASHVLVSLGRGMTICIGLYIVISLVQTKCR